MAQIPTATYLALAVAYDGARRAIVGAETFMDDAVDAIVDLTSTTEGAAAMEIAMLSPVNESRTAVTTTVNSTSGILLGVRAINNYVINNSTATTTQVATHGTKLTYFVKVTMDQVWDQDTMVPYYWEE